MKFDIRTLLDREGLSDQRKKLIAAGGIGFVVLLFGSFLLSLSEDDTKENSPPPVGAQTVNPIDQGSLAPQDNGLKENSSNSLELPSSKRYEFDANDSNESLESLLQDDPTPPQYGVNNNPFANMQGQGTQALGPAPIPTEEEELANRPQTLPSFPSEEQTQAPTAAPAPAPRPAARPISVKANLYCDSFNTSGEAESQKAMLAFQGLSATVVKGKDGKFQLRIGPYDTSDVARKKFEELADKGLVNRCSLITE